MSIVGQHHREHHEQEDLLRERVLEARVKITELEDENRELRKQRALLLESQTYWMSAGGGGC